MPCDSFEELQIPTKVLATDIQTGNEIVYEEGNLKEAIIQSSSIPGFFEATFSNDKIIVDGNNIARHPNISPSIANLIKMKEALKEKDSMYDIDI